jgi:hypothetical protein
MAPDLATTSVCAECGAELAPLVSVCPGCGTATTVAAAQKPPQMAGFRSLVDRPWLILGLLFFVTAALGLPLLWISRGFSLAWKIVLSVLVTLYTALLLWGFWWIMNWSVSRIMESLR